MNDETTYTCPIYKQIVQIIISERDNDKSDEEQLA